MKRFLCTFLVASALVSIGANAITNATEKTVVEKNDLTLNAEEKAVNWYDSISYFAFEAKNNGEVLKNDIIAFIQNDNIYCVVPRDVDVTKLVATFYSYATDIKVNGVSQQSGGTSNNYSNELTFVVNGKANYKVNVIKSDLPTIEINTENNAPIYSKEEYLNATMKISGTEEEAYSGDIQIRGRGNSTWGMPKKPYRIKLGKKNGLLGMDVEKDWVLIANYSDKTLIRNKLALDLAAELGESYTSDSRYVEVILNGEYVGNYLLCEQVEVSESRVNIDELEDTDTDPEVITGGYFFEVDYRFDADTVFKTKLGVPMTYKSPKVPNKEQHNYITGYIDELETALSSKDFTVNGKHYSEYIDVDSFVDYYWINELYKNWDAAFRTSVNMYKPRDGKITMGPVWDFDIGAGNADFNDFQGHLDNTSPEDWWMRYEGWYGYLFKDPEFVEKINNRFWELLDVFESVPDKIDSYAEEIKISQGINFKRWDILGQYVWPNVYVGKTYDEDLNYLKTWFTKRVEWLKKTVPESTNKPEENIFDINKDSVVNISDLAILSKNINKYDSSMDLNKDGKLDKEDIMLLMKEILEK